MRGWPWNGRLWEILPKFKDDCTPEEFPNCTVGKPLSYFLEMLNTWENDNGLLWRLYQNWEVIARLKNVPIVLWVCLFHIFGNVCSTWENGNGLLWRLYQNWEVIAGLKNLRLALCDRSGLICSEEVEFVVRRISGVVASIWGVVVRRVSGVVVSIRGVVVRWCASKICIAISGVKTGLHYYKSWVRVCACVCMCVCVCVCIYIYMGRFASQIRTGGPRFVCVWGSFFCVCVCDCMYVYMYVCVCTYTYIVRFAL